MSRFYIDTSYGILRLTSTTDVRVNKSSRVSKHPLERGRNEVVDNFVNENVTISFNGIISNIRAIDFDVQGSSDQFTVGQANASDQRSVSDFFNILDLVREKRELFTVFYDTTLFPVQNCLITNLEYSTDKTKHNAYQVSLGFEQIRLVEQADITVSRDDQVEPDLSQEKTDSDGSNTEEQDLSSETIFARTGSAIFDLPIGDLAGGNGG